MIRGVLQLWTSDYLASSLNYMINNRAQCLDHHQLVRARVASNITGSMLFEVLMVAGLVLVPMI